MLYRYINISVKYKIVYIFFQQNKMRSCFVELNIIIFGIGRFITNQQNIYRVTPVHYLQKAEKKT